MNKPLANAALQPDTNVGLDGVVVANTILSDVDGLAGRLIIRGYQIEDLAGHFPFEQAVAKLWQNLVPMPEGDLTAAFAAARVKAWAAVPCLKIASTALSVYELMRLGLNALPLEGDATPAVSISAALPVFLAAAYRIKNGLEPIAPDASLTTSEDLYRMLKDAEAPAYARHAIDRYLVTILDHGLNASTFTTRVIASTQADMLSAIIGAMGALKGPLHGGAPGPVLDMIDAVGSPDKADEWIETALATGKRLMGFGHRIYRTRDPRADVLKEGLDEMPRDNERVILAEAVEAAALKALAKRYPDRPLQTNVEFYTAVLLDAVGIDRSLFTPLFATGRTPGWCAHVVEQQEAGRLIRPASTYIGPDA